MIHSAISPTELARGAVDGLIPIYKKLGETPLEALNRLRSAFSGLEKVPLSYAGRLDPLAEGLLLVLSGTFNNKRQDFLGLDKVYEVEVLFGVSSDTGDIMGKLKNNSALYLDTALDTAIEFSDTELKELSEKIVGTHDFPYPVFSSKAVLGKPLHAWAREGKLHEIEIPKTSTTVHAFKFLGSKNISNTDLEKEILSRIGLVHGEFRQAEISQEWSECLNRPGIHSFQVVKFEISTASGAYMRTLAEYIGKLFKTEALAYSIKRQSVGTINLSDCIEL